MGMAKIGRDRYFRLASDKMYSRSILRSRIAPAVFALLVLATVGCGTETPVAATSDTIEVVTAIPISKQIVEWDEYTGRLEPIEFVEVRARVGGYLQAYYFKEGDIVKQGDLLFVIDPRPYQAKVKESEAAVTQARAREVEARSALASTIADRKAAESQVELEVRRFRRAEVLVQDNTIAKEEFDVREAALAQAQANLESATAKVSTAEAEIAATQAAIGAAVAELESAQLDLSYTQIRAAVGGRVSKREVTEGNLVSGGTADSTLLTTIVSLDPIHCYFDADEAAFLKYQRLAADGSRASSRESKNPIYLGLADEKPAYPHPGHMDFVDNRLDPNAGTMRGRAILRNPDFILTPGLFARLRLPGSGTYNAILVPDSAISSDQSEKFVYVVEDDGTIRQQDIKLGPIVHGLRVVRAGLKGTEKIIIRGLQRVRPDVKAKTTLAEIKLRDDEGLPDSYVPVPEDQWISRSSAAFMRDGGASVQSPRPVSEPGVQRASADVPAASPAMKP
jgi:RND family efflux transporter MFP subunit